MSEATAAERSSMPRQNSLTRLPTANWASFSRYSAGMEHESEPPSPVTTTRSPELHENAALAVELDAVAYLDAVERFGLGDRHVAFQRVLAVDDGDRVVGDCLRLAGDHLGAIRVLLLLPAEAGAAASSESVTSERTSDRTNRLRPLPGQASIPRASD